MTSNSIGQVSVDFVAEFSRFRDDMAKAARAVKDNTSSMAASFKAVQQAVALVEGGLKLFGIGLAAKEIADFVAGAIKAGAQLKALAQQTGLSTTAFQVWQFAARSAGTSTDAMTSGVENLTRKIGEAAAGNGDAIKTFKDLGIGVLDAANNIRPTEDILQQIAQKMVAAKTPADQARIAFEAFGRTGQQLIPTLLEMGRGSDEVAARAQDMFQVLSPQAIENLDAIENDFSIMKTEALNLAAALAQYLKPVFDGLIDALSWANQELRDFLDWSGKVIDQAKRLVTGDTSVTGRRLFVVPPPATSFPGDSQHNPPSDSQVRAAADAAKKQADAIKRVVEALQHEYDNLGKDSEEQKLNTALRQANVTATSAAGQQIAGIIHQGEAYRDLLTEMNKEEKDRLDLQRQAQELMASLETPAEKFADQMAELDKYYQAGAIDIDQYNLAVARMNAAYEETDPQVKKATEDAKQFQDSVNSLAEDLGTELARAFTDAGSAADRFKNLAVHALEDVLNSVVKLLLTSAGGSGGGGLGDIFGSLLGSLFGGGSSAPAGVSPEIGMNFTGITHFAGGGDFGAGELAVVGENGPELVQFGRAGHVFPTGTGIRSGGGTVITIDARGADLAAVARIERGLDSLHRNFEQRAIAAVNGQRKRGGSFAASFRR